MTDKSFTLLFFGIINAFMVTMCTICYYTGEVGGLAVLIPTGILIAVVSFHIIWTEVINGV